MLVKCGADANGYIICEVYRHCVANHLISHIDIIVKKYIVVWECLNTGDLPDRHPPIQMFLSWNKNLLVRLNLNHFRRLWMKLALPSACLYCKSWFIPSSYSVAG